MKSIILPGILLLIIVVGGFFGYKYYAAYNGLESVVTKLRADAEKSKKDATELSLQLAKQTPRFNELEEKERQWDVVKVALASGVALTIVDDAVKSAKNPTPDHYLAMGAIRLVVKGKEDAEIKVAFQKAMQMSNWPTAMKSTCAAQSGMAALGNMVEMPVDCKKIFALQDKVEGANAAADAAKADPAKAAEAKGGDKKEAKPKADKPGN
jgi:hypothetical protein